MLYFYTAYVQLYTEVVVNKLSDLMNTMEEVGYSVKFIVYPKSFEFEIAGLNDKIFFLNLTKYVMQSKLN